MTASSITTRTDMPASRVLGAYLAEIRSECLRYLRNPGFMLPMTLFSTVFYLMFGVVMSPPGGEASRYLLASYSAFGIMGPGLFGFGVSLAIERDGGLLTLKRALPMPPGAYLLGKMVMAMAAAGVVVTLLLLIGVLVAHVPLSAGQVAAMLAMGVFGVLPFCALGMFIGTLIKGQGAPGLLNLVYLPMAFLSGLWIPLRMMPSILGRIAPVWPSYHLNQIGQRIMGLSHAPILGHVLILLVVAAVLFGLAARRLRRHG
ncbi:ABC transporter permease [Oleiagrimonas sp.]|jgi:ABC-2 type transport system permease protein|uniref:ABC transporter permease n=1 Tax=Oleiagrimonas sp. TaxID=2010330 RepID=UPI0026278166|nr:ABC transporter permease [Oleiagrimonas sp.]MDA3913776.1 ABC transporter permease [Oleiagrimonas sp.]